ncbi:MAG TPA: hypothetical protein VGL44_16725 [Gaiellales bacterium]
MSVVVGVTPGYLHRAKLATPGERLSLAGADLKWYEVAPAGTPVPAHVRELAHARLAADARAGALGITGETGFVILHRCGEGFHFLILCTWRNRNEVWETVWAKDGDGDPEFRPWPAHGPHRPTFCVWELGVVCHESRAWSRCLRAGCTPAALRTYLDDRFDGTV